MIYIRSVTIYQNTELNQELDQINIHIGIIYKKSHMALFFKNPDATDAIVDTYPLLRHEWHYERQNLIL